MKANYNKSNEGKDSAPITGDRKVPNEITPPMPKPERKDEDNDFTKEDENDPLRKEKIDLPSKPPLRKEEDDDDQNHIQEPVAEGEDEKVIRDSKSKMADESLAKTADVNPKMI